MCCTLHVFQRKIYVTKAEGQDVDTECSSELEGEEHGENSNMVEANIEIKIEAEFPI